VRRPRPAPSTRQKPRAEIRWRRSEVRWLRARPSARRLAVLISDL
jgi:hypothetical protein